MFKKSNKEFPYAGTLDGYTPIFSQFGRDIYVSDVVQQALKCIVDEITKLTPRHTRGGYGIGETLSSDIQAILDFPNEIMTQSDFIEKFIYSLLLNYNSFIVPTYYTWENSQGVKKRVYTGLYPVQPTQVDFIEDASNTIFIKMHFANNYETTLPYSDVIHIRYKYSVNEYMGGNQQGQPDHQALLKILELNHNLLEGVSQAMKSSFAINGVVKYNTVMDQGKTENALKELESKLKKSESGFLPLDLKSEFTPIKKELKMVDGETLKFIDEKILRNFGIPVNILTGNFTKEEHEAFYEKTIKSVVIKISQAFIKALFTRRELVFGNRVNFCTENLLFMGMSMRLELVDKLGESGTITENEKRQIVGLPPLEDLENVRMQSLNWVNVELAKTYQTNGAESGIKGGEEVVEEPNDEEL